MLRTVVWKKNQTIYTENNFWSTFNSTQKSMITVWFKELKLTRKQFKGTYSTLCGPLYFLGLKSSFDFFFLLALHISFHFSSLIFSFCWAFSIHDLSGVILMGKVLRKDFRILGLNWRKASSLYIALPNFTLQLYKVFAKF